MNRFSQQIMRCDFDPQSIQQVIDCEFTELHDKLKMARTEEEKLHLIIDTQQYIRGLRDFYRSVTPIDIPSHALAAGNVDDEVMTRTILDAAYHHTLHLLEQTEASENCINNWQQHFLRS